MGYHLLMNNINFLTFLRTSAESREELRPQDVDRVMTLASEEGHGEAFRAWLLGAKAFVLGTQSEIENWSPE